MKSLLAKLEAATEGSRELDREVWLFLGKPLEEVEMARQMVAEGRGNEYLPTGDERRLRADCTAQTCYWPVTQSLDAALTLVPKGMRWLLRDDGKDSDIFPPKARISGAPLDTNDHWYGNAPTAPLALCIAALRTQGETE